MSCVFVLEQLGLLHLYPQETISRCRGMWLRDYIDVYSIPLLCLTAFNPQMNDDGQDSPTHELELGMEMFT